MWQDLIENLVFLAFLAVLVGASFASGYYYQGYKIYSGMFAERAQLMEAIRK